MLGLDGAAADVDRGGVNLFDPQQVHRNAGARNIRDRIHRADFVEVQFLDRHAVNLGFGFAQAAEYGRCLLLRATGKASAVNKIEDL